MMSWCCLVAWCFKVLHDWCVILRVLTYDDEEDGATGRSFHLVPEIIDYNVETSTLGYGVPSESSSSTVGEPWCYSGTLPSPRMLWCSQSRSYCDQWVIPIRKSRPRQSLSKCERAVPQHAGHIDIHDESRWPQVLPAIATLAEGWIRPELDHITSLYYCIHYLWAPKNKALALRKYTIYLKSISSCPSKRVNS